MSTDSKGRAFLPAVLAVGIAALIGLALAWPAQPSSQTSPAATGATGALAASPGHESKTKPRPSAKRARGGEADGDAPLPLQDASTLTAPMTPEERAQWLAERRAARDEARARWQERKLERLEEKRQRILESVANDPEKVRYWQERFARRDARDREHEERRTQRRAEHAQRAQQAREQGVAPRPAGPDSPVLGPPVIGPDGVAYDPRAPK